MRSSPDAAGKRPGPTWRQQAVVTSAKVRRLCAPDFRAAGQETLCASQFQLRLRFRFPQASASWVMGDWGVCDQADCVTPAATTNRSAPWPRCYGCYMRWERPARHLCPSRCFPSLAIEFCLRSCVSRCDAGFLIQTMWVMVASVAQGQLLNLHGPVRRPLCFAVRCMSHSVQSSMCLPVLESEIRQAPECVPPQACVFAE